MLDRLRETPRAVRDVLLILLQRGEEKFEGMRVPFHEIRQVTGLGKQTLTEYVQTLGALPTRRVLRGLRQHPLR
jgi:hypothetical protein